MFAGAVAALTEGVDALADIDPAGLGIAEQLRLLDVLETAKRRLPAVSHTVALAAAKSDAPTVRLFELKRAMPGQGFGVSWT